VRFVRIAVILVGAAVLALFVLWTAGPHSAPGSSNHGAQVAAFVAVVVVCLVATHRLWSSRISH